MSELPFPYSQFGSEPFRLRDRINTVYHLLKLKLEALDEKQDWTFDEVIDDVASGIRQNNISARIFEEWCRFPSNEPPSSFNAFRIAVAFWLEAHYAERASDSAQSTAALFAAYFYLGIVEAPRTVTEAAAKGGEAISSLYRPLEQAAIAAAERLVTQGHMRAHKSVPLSTPWIIPLIAKDKAVAAANEGLGLDLTRTLTRWTRTDSGGRARFREAYLRITNAWREQRKTEGRKPPSGA